MSALPALREVGIAEQGMGELARIANEEHQAVEHAAVEMVVHGVRAGEALRAVRDRLPYGSWMAWLAENFHATPHTAREYIRFAQHQDLLNEHGITKYVDALQLVRSVAAEGRPSLDERVRQRSEAVALYKAGGISLAKVGELYGVDGTTIRRWVNPNYAEAIARREAKRAKEARRALQQQRRDRAARKVGGDLGKTYSLIRQALQTTERQREEAASRDKRMALRGCLTALHEAEDQISRAIRCLEDA